MTSSKEKPQVSRRRNLGLRFQSPGAMCGKLSPPDTFPSLFGRLLAHNLRKAGVGIGTLYTARATAFRRGPSGCVYKAMIQVARTAEELVNEHIDFRTGES